VIVNKLLASCRAIRNSLNVLSERDRPMFDLAYFGGLRVSELVTLTWAQVFRRDSEEAQLEIVGKGSKRRQVLIPAAIAARLFDSRGDAPASAPVFHSVRRPGSPLTEPAVSFIVKVAAERAGVNSVGALASRKLGNHGRV
jgi:integrase/recombinase XerD